MHPDNFETKGTEELQVEQGRKSWDSRWGITRGFKTITVEVNLQVSQTFSRGGCVSCLRADECVLIYRKHSLGPWQRRTIGYDRSDQLKTA